MLGDRDVGGVLLVIIDHVQNLLPELLVQDVRAQARGVLDQGDVSGVLLGHELTTGYRDVDLRELLYCGGAALAKHAGGLLSQFLREQPHLAAVVALLDVGHQGRKILLVAVTLVPLGDRDLHIAS